MIKILKNKLVETITKSDIDKLHTEVLMFTKNIKRIDSAEDYKKVAEVANEWGKKLHNFYYKKFVGNSESRKSLNSHDDQLLKFYIEKTNKTVWDLSLYMSSAFPISVISGSLEEYGDEWNNPYQGWPALFTKFKMERNSRFSTFIFKQKKAFDDLYELIDYIKETDDKAVDIRRKINGFNLTVTISEFDEDAEVYYNMFKRQIDKAVDSLTKKGFGKIINPLKKDVTFVIDKQKANTQSHGNFSSDAAAFYDKFSKTIVLDPYWTIDNYHSLIHEIGHWLHLSLIPKKFEIEWNEFINNNTLRLDTTEINEFGDHIQKVLWDQLSKMISKDKTYSDTMLLFDYDGKQLTPSELDNKIKGLVKSIIKDEVDKQTIISDPLNIAITRIYNNKKLQFRNISRLVVEDKRFNESILDIIDDVFSKSKMGNFFNIPLPEIYTTHYGSTNEKETFAEAFACYVTGKDRDSEEREKISDSLITKLRSYI